MRRFNNGLLPCRNQLRLADSIQNFAEPMDINHSNHKRGEKEKERERAHFASTPQPSRVKTHARIFSIGASHPIDEIGATGKVQEDNANMHPSTS